MGKAGRKKKRNMNSLRKTSNESPEGFNAKEVLYGLDSTVIETRIASSGIIAALFGDADTDLIQDMEKEENRSRTNIKYAIRAQIPKRLITHLSDSSEAVVMNCLGALRNMSISGGNEVIQLLIQQDVLTPFHSLLLNYISKLSQPILSVYTPQILIQAFSFLTLLIDYDPEVLSMIQLDLQLFEAIYYCIKYKDPQIQRSACECLDLITDRNPLPPSISQDLSIYITQTEGYVKSRLLSIYFSSHPPQNESELEPYIIEIQKGFEVHLPHEIIILKDIYHHIEEDQKKRAQALSEVLGVPIDSEIDENSINKNSDMNINSDRSENTEQRKKEIIYKNAIERYLSILTTLSGYIDLLKSIIKLNNEEESIRLIPIHFIESLFNSLLKLIQPSEDLLSLSPYILAPTLDIYISIYECLDVMNIYVENLQIPCINSLWPVYITPCVPLQPILPLYSSKPIFNSITKCIWSYLEAIHRYKQDHDMILEPISLQPILNISTLAQLIQAYPSTIPPVFNIIALYITLYPPHPDHIPYIQLLLDSAHSTSSNQSALELYSSILDNLMTIFSDTPSIPLYIQLQVHPIFKQLLKAIDKLLSSFLGDYDEDIVNYAAATIENGHNFVTYIEEEIKKYPTNSGSI